ncbi:MAG: hypothetical protein D6800_13430, partial [Candidatus Zixiibacteriota bacterium]
MPSRQHNNPSEERKFQQAEARKRYFSRGFLATALLMVCWGTATVQAIPENLNGSIQLTGVTSTAGEADVQSLDQRYTLNWRRQLTPYVSLQGVLTYNRFATNLSEGGNVWQRQVQPLGELQWSHPYFTFLTSYGRRTKTSNDHTTDLVQKTFTASLSSRMEKYATALLSYDFTHTYNSFDRRQRDSRDHVLRATFGRSYRGGTLNYSITHEKNDVASSFLEQTSTFQQFRWTQTNQFLDSRLRVTADYTFDNRHQTDKLVGADTTVRPIDILAALYARDATPELGNLKEVAGLNDGDVSRPTDPVIDIGRGVGDQNLGVDFGFTRSVRGCYVYTDVPSGAALRWDVYVSADNVIWTRLATDVRVSYNNAFLRYEIFFDQTDTRYLKVVNTGVNDVITVHVTEVQALEEFTRDAKNSRAQTVHRLSTDAAYHLATTLSTHANFYYRAEPGGAFSNSRDELVVAFGVTHAPSTRVSQTLTWQTSWASFPKTTGKDKDVTITYVLKAAVDDFARARLTAYHRNNTVAAVPFQEAHSVSLQLNSQVLPGLEWQFEGDYNRNNQLVAAEKLDTWTWHTGVAAELLSGFKVRSSFLYQTTTEPGATLRQIRRVYSADIAYQLSSSISLSGSVTAGSDEDRRYV